MISKALSPPLGGKMALFVCGALRPATGMPPPVVLPGVSCLHSPKLQQSEDAEQELESWSRHQPSIGFWTIEAGNL